MAFVARIEILTAALPFRFSFGHALAARRSSTNLFVKLTLDDGTVGFGEGVPREYVTGETIAGAVAALAGQYAPALLGRALPDPAAVPVVLDAVAAIAMHAAALSGGAAWCALELALLDAAGRRFGLPVQHWLGPVRAPRIRYDAVLPFTTPRVLPALALLVRLLGIRHVKLKVGGDTRRDMHAIRVLRRTLGPRADLRVDANCAWTSAEALAALARFRPYRPSAVEQPVPADDLAGLRRVTAATPELIVADESLRTAGEAEALAAGRTCDAFNIRVSKCGGLRNAVRIAQVANAADLACVVGAQVGESGLLSAAGRHLAATIAPRYVEGSAGRLLLREDITMENVLPGYGGLARPFTGPGLGVRVREATLRRYAQSCHTLVTATAT